MVTADNDRFNKLQLSLSYATSSIAAWLMIWSILQKYDQQLLSIGCSIQRTGGLQTVERHAGNGSWRNIAPIALFTTTTIEWFNHDQALAAQSKAALKDNGSLQIFSGSAALPLDKRMRRKRILNGVDSNRPRRHGIVVRGPSHYFASRSFEGACVGYKLAARVSCVGDEGQANSTPSVSLQHVPGWHCQHAMAIRSRPAPAGPVDGHRRVHTQSSSTVLPSQSTQRLTDDVEQTIWELWFERH